MKTLTPNKKKRIIDTIVTEFKRIGTSIPTLNSGGCGVFAYEAYKLLISLGLNVKLGVLTYNKQSMIYCLRNNSSASASPFGHIVLCVGRRLIDSDGIYTNVNEIKDYTGYDVIKGMSMELLAEWLIEPHGWNRRFDKAIYEPIIKKEMKRIEKDLVASI